MSSQPDLSTPVNSNPKRWVTKSFFWVFKEPPRPASFLGERCFFCFFFFFLSKNKIKANKSKKRGDLGGDVRKRRASSRTLIPAGATEINQNGLGWISTIISGQRRLRQRERDEHKENSKHQRESLTLSPLRTFLSICSLFKRSHGIRRVNSSHRTIANEYTSDFLSTSESPEIIKAAAASTSGAA